ncbi:MAG: hypothetical protein JJE15_12745 [Desulfobacteraceae bacterium]|nr:hypothetical protein [Desulfobacteraceae bacterium]
MKVISVIEDEEIIKKILKHLGLWEIKARPPPRVTGSPKIQEYKIDYSASQLPVSDKWLCVDPEYREGYPASDPAFLLPPVTTRFTGHSYHQSPENFPLMPGFPLEK